MNLRIERTDFSPFSTIGDLLIDGELFCFSLEPVWREDDIKPRAIPPGTYKLTNRYSPKHQRNVPHVEDVPGFDEVEIHPGNFPKDTQACILVGKKKARDYVSDSRVTFADLWEKLVPVWDGGEEINITYVNKQEVKANVALAHSD